MMNNSTEVVLNGSTSSMTSSVSSSMPSTQTQVAVAASEGSQVLINILVLVLVCLSEIRGTLSFSALLSAFLSEIIVNIILIFTFTPGLRSTPLLKMLTRLTVVSLRWVSIQSMATLSWILDMAVCHWQTFRVQLVKVKVHVVIAALWVSNLLGAVVFFAAMVFLPLPNQQAAIKKIYFVVDVASRLIPLVVLVTFYVKINVFSKRLSQLGVMSRPPIQPKIVFSRAMMGITAVKVLGLLIVTVQAYVTNFTDVINIQVVKVLSNAATVITITILCPPVRDLVVTAARRCYHACRTQREDRVFPAPPVPPRRSLSSRSNGCRDVIDVQPYPSSSKTGASERACLYQMSEV